jgi:hypothetical protein
LGRPRDLLILTPSRVRLLSTASTLVDGLESFDVRAMSISESETLVVAGQGLMVWIVSGF